MKKKPKNEVGIPEELTPFLGEIAQMLVDDFYNRLRDSVDESKRQQAKEKAERKARVAAKRKARGKKHV